MRASDRRLEAGLARRAPALDAALALRRIALVGNGLVTRRGFLTNWTAHLILQTSKVRALWVYGPIPREF